jgi:hypothetical protein
MARDEARTAVGMWRGHYSCARGQRCRTSTSVGGNLPVAFKIQIKPACSTSSGNNIPALQQTALQEAHAPRHAAIRLHRSVVHRTSFHRCVRCLALAHTAPALSDPAYHWL